ncbi:MAG: restriction endonuclease subunit S [Segatella sp.]|jgi:type I restriction-modification system specificity determinant
MQTYDSYKDSGEQWLGRIPSHWEIRRSKFLWKETDRRSQKGTEQLLSVSQYDGVREANAESRSESLVGYKYVHKDEFVINIMLAWLGGLGISNFEGVVSPAYCVYHLKDKQNPRFLHYLYRTPQYLAEFARHSTGIVPSRWRMYTDDFGDVLTILPPIKEQNRMVQYLDEQTSQIDEAIAQQQKMIDLLNERKQMIINNAVTKGLDPNVPMKDCGIDWIGEIPKHWETRRMRYLCKIKTGDKDTVNRVDDGVYPFYVRSPKVERINSYTYDGEAVLMAGDGVGAGKVFHYVNGKFGCHQRVYIFHDITHVYGEYLFFYMKSLFKHTIEQLSAKSTVDSVRLNMIQDFIVAFPSKEEQSAILAYLNEQMNKFNIAITNAEQKVVLLQERKQIIINNVVTGKIKV